MSLLLDALKKSEAQRRRGTSPTIDLTRSPPATGPRRTGSRWLFYVLAGVLLVAAVPWLWPQLSDWMEPRPDGSDAAVAVVAVKDDGASTAGPEAASASESRAEAVADQPGAAPPPAPAPVAGAASPRRVAAAASPAVVSDAAEAADRAPETDGGSDTAVDAAAAADTAAATAKADVRPASAPAEPKAEPSGQGNAPSENFIRPWELPQGQRAEFPELRLTVHFYAPQPADRFVLINGERYREGQRVGPGTTLVEIRQRGAIVDYGRYRVLIE